MLIFDMGIESRIAEVSFAADADVVSLHGVVSGSSFSSGDELVLTLVHSLLGVHSKLNYMIYDYMCWH